VCDFGIAKVASERDGEGSAITMAGMVCGTPEYMSPEQARGDALDGRSDLYAMAVILYQMVTGDVPFRAESALGVITKHLTEEPTPPSKRRTSGVPEAVEAVILRGLKKDREERFATASEMRAALFDAVGMKRSSSSSQQQRATGSVPADAWAQTGVATPVSNPAQAATTPAASSHPSVHGELAAQPGGGRNTGVLVATLAIVAALAGGAWVMFGKKGDPAVVLPPPQAQAPKVEAPEAPPPTPPAPKEPAAQPVAAPIPPAPEPTPPTVLAAAAPAHSHKKHESHAASSPAAARPVAAAPVAAAAPPPEVSKPAAPKGAFAEGEALFKSGDVEGALAKYQDAARANPSDAKAQKMIGKCYNRLGQHDRAVPYLKRYLELNPDASDKAFIQAQIDQK
jgi:serine/threonine-protein kinase